MEKYIHLLFNRKIASNQKGYTLTELMTVIAIISVVVLGNTLFINDFLKRMTAYEKESMNESELAILNTMALNILKKSSLSFNLVSQADDNNRNFYDYYPDMPLGSFTNEERTFTLSAPSTTRFLYIISTEEGKSASTVFDPMHAYAIAAPAANLVTDTTLSYTGLNSVPNITDASGSAATLRVMSQIFGKRWAAGELFVVYCPSYLRPKATVTLGLTTVPRMPAFIGKVSGNDLSILTNTEASITMLNTHPITTIAYTNLNNYFMTLPTVGGAAPFVKVEPVELNRFEFRANTSYPSGYGDLYLNKWKNSAYGSSILVATKIKSVVFKRTSVTLPLISLEIEK